MNNFITIIVLLFSTATFAQDFNLSIQRDDNDFATYQDVHSKKVKNPQIVIDAFKSIVKERSKDVNKLSFYSYKVVVNEELEIYALTINSFLENDAYVMVFDKEKNRLSKAPIVINLKSSFNNEVGFTSKILEYPLINILKNKSDVIVCLRERVHNGNVYNAVLNKRYLIQNDLSLKLQFCYEEKSLLDDSTCIRRLLVNDNTLEIFEEKNCLSNYIGQIKLDVYNIAISDRICQKKEYCDLLFTASGMSEDELLKNGTVFQY